MLKAEGCQLCPLLASACPAPISLDFSSKPHLLRCSLPERTVTSHLLPAFESEAPFEVGDQSIFQVCRVGVPPARPWLAVHNGAPKN